MTEISGKPTTLRDLHRILDKRRSILILTIGVVFLLAVLASVFSTRRYESTGVFQLEKSSTDALDLQDMMGGGASGASDALSVNTDLQTQADILKSDALALHVIKELKLEENNEDFRPKWNPLGWFLNLFSPRGVADPANVPLELAPHRRVQALKVFRRHLDVKVNVGTRLIAVSFSNRDPRVAAAVVNHLIQALIDYSFQTKFTATNQASRWLEDQLGDLRKTSENLQAKAVSLQHSSGIFGVGGEDINGKPVIFSPVLEQLQQASTDYSQAQMNRVLKESVYQIAKTGDPELISQLAGTSIASQASPGFAGALNLVQSLRAQEATLKSQLTQDATRYGEANPKIVQDRASLESVEASLHAEVGRIGERAKSDYQVALSTERGLKDKYEEERQLAEKLNDKTIEYSIVARESEQSQELYQDLLKRLKEAGIVQGLHSSNITIVDPALVPDKPSHPNVPLLLALGLAFGVFLGVGGALTAEAIDNKIRGVEEIETLGLFSIGILPEIKGTDLRGKPAILQQTSTYAEAIRGLRSSLLIARSGTPPKVVLVTSANPAEGKSTVSLNIAAALAQMDKRVLLVEADMRRPVFAKRLGISQSAGLSVILSDQRRAEEPGQLPDIPNCFVIPAGPTPPYPTELLSSKAMEDLIAKWSESYDFVVLDSPPVLPVTDSQALIKHADATVLIARAGISTRVSLQRSYKLLLPHVKDASHPAIGVLLNAVSLTSAAYYGYYGYYGGKRYYGGGE